MSEIKLENCPFCGYEASMTQVESAAGHGRMTWIVGCNSEDCDVSFHGHARQKDAATAWNTRKPNAEWREVKDGLPESECNVLVTHKNGEIYLKTYVPGTEDEWWRLHYIAWMPIPIPPYQPSGE